MKLYTNGTDWVVAADVDDAWLAWTEHTGESREDYEDDWVWDEVGPDEELGIWCDTKGDPCEVDEDGSEIVAKTAAQWAERGRGFLCST